VSTDPAAQEDLRAARPDESFLQRHPRLRRELLILAWSLGAGLILMPTLVYVVGMLTLGPYTSGGWWTLFADLYKGLFRVWWPAWAVVLGPLVLICMIRVARLVYRRYLRSELA
jgi:hypothetical protein